MRSKRSKVDAHANVIRRFIEILKVPSHFSYILSLDCKYLRIENILEYLNPEDVKSCYSVVQNN
jgi:hypothetical protein